MYAINLHTEGKRKVQGRVCGKKEISIRVDHHVTDDVSTIAWIRRGGEIFVVQ